MVYTHLLGEWRTLLEDNHPLCSSGIAPTKVSTEITPVSVVTFLCTKNKQIYFELTSMLYGTQAFGLTINIDTIRWLFTVYSQRIARLRLDVDATYYVY